MKLIGAAFGIALMCSIGAGAQTATTKVDGKSKVTVKDGKEITISGCVERNPSGGYMLTDSGTGGMKYALVTDDDLSKHVGHKVEVKGNATDLGNAKVKTESNSSVRTRRMPNSRKAPKPPPRRRTVRSDAFSLIASRSDV